MTALLRGWGAWERRGKKRILAFFETYLRAGTR
jgi:hypothetical protein